MSIAPYMPLLLAASTNAALIADDSHLETQARGQVDYLSHEWDEDDIARSWRNMTRQKNDIANGMRLENASWRTWWKQRNKLKTISPETLNWLKDSDVTWLYGPLHTAVDWTPPPKPKEDPTSVDDRAPSSAQDRLDLHVYKPILKHRTISEQLTSDLPSGMVSPRIPEHLDGVPEDPEFEDSQDGFSRPSIVYAKSDTNIAHSTQTDRNLKAIAISEDIRQGTPIPAPSPLPISRAGSASSSNSASPSPNPDGTPRKRRPSKHITFNTYVEQCISIDKPQGPAIMRHSASNLNLRREKEFSMPMRASSQPTLNAQPPPQPHKWDGRTSGVRWAGNVEDEHDDSSPSSSSDEAPIFAPQAQPPFPHEVKKKQHPLGRDSAIGSSDDDDYEDVWEETTTESSTSTNQDDDDDEDDGVIEMRSRRNSSSSGAPSESTDTPGPPLQLRAELAAIGEARRQRRRSSNGTVVAGALGNNNRSPSIVDLGSLPDTPRVDSNNHQTQTHMTIAPIAPTTLKTDWDSFGVGINVPGRVGNILWQEGFGEDEDGDYTLPAPPVVTSKGLHAQNEGGELVYAPKYSQGFRSDPTDDRLEENDNQIWHHEEAYFSSADADKASSNASSQGDETEAKSGTSPIPVVVRTPAAPQAADAYDYFEGPDFGEDFEAPVKADGRRSYSSRGGADSGDRESRRATISDEPERGRSRSRSRSRTPSPLNSPPTVSPPSRLAGHSKTLSPPSRAKIASSSSPVVSISLAGTPTSVGLAYAGGRSDQKERERSTSTSPPDERRQRGRQRTERKLSHSLSPPDVSRSYIPPLPPSSAVIMEDADEYRSRNPTPASSPTIHMGLTDVGMVAARLEAEASRKRAYGDEISPPSSPTTTSSSSGGGAILGRAAGVVNSAGAYFGLWRGGRTP